MAFQLHHQDTLTKARVGTLTTAHGQIKTPIFMPVGTVGTVKAVPQRTLTDEVKAQIILGNTYHLYLRPGLDILKQAGGLHQFIHWDRPMLTDSGGYQVYSLSEIRKIKEEGAEFRSHIDGSKHFFTPERVMDIQRIIGADIIMAFDECTPYPCEYEYAKKSMELTHRWLKRCVQHFNQGSPLYGHEQFLFPIVQGSTFQDLRKISAQEIASYDQPGYAIGGLSVGELAEMMYDMTELVCDLLPQQKPRYLMGVGTPANILECIALGVDMFDCVMPTRNGRNGMLFTTKGILNIKKNCWKDDFSPIDDGLENHVSNYYSKAYLRHLFASNERLAAQIASEHNLCFYLDLVGKAREQIINGQFANWKRQQVEMLMQKL